MKTIALFVQHPTCSVQSANGVLKALGNRYRYKIFSKHEVEDDFFDDVDLICIPGGLGDSDKFDHYFETNTDKIKQFVRKGGKYLGICMGGYWADMDYFSLLPKSYRVVQYIKRPHTDTKRPHAKNLQVVWNEKKERMYFYDGCAVIGNEDKFEVVARYMNGDPMAIIYDNIGIIGCHLESEVHWYDEYSWMRGKYHDGRHHKLLLDFVDRMML